MKPRLESGKVLAALIRALKWVTMLSTHIISNFEAMHFLSMLLTSSELYGLCVSFGGGDCSSESV